MRSVHEIRFRFDRDFIAAGLRRDFIWRAALMFAVLIATFAVVVIVVMDNRPTLLAMTIMAAGLGIVSARLLAAFRGGVERTYQLWVKQSPSMEVCYRLDDEAIHIELDHATSRYHWGEFRRLWRYSDVWLLEIVSMASVFFPAPAAPPDACAFLVERCRAAGVRV